MKRPALVLAILLVLAFGVAPSAAAAGQRPGAPAAPATDEAKVLAAMHSISSNTLMDYVRELASKKYGGRLTGTPEYNACADWVADLFKSWGLAPAGDEGTFFQSFPNPYTLVLPDCEVSMAVPLPNSKETTKKYYQYEEEFIPGGTSGTGEVTADVVYVGYGITAPELKYDDYKGVDVRGKIVLMEPEGPVSAWGGDAETFKKWRPYTFHQYKFENAIKHGAKAFLYNYGPICNPNNSYRPDFLYAHVGEAVVNDVFAGTGKDHAAVLKAIQAGPKPQSFDTKKVFTVRTATIHHPEGVGRTVAAMLEGSDPALKDQVIILGGHLDHVGRCWTMFPGANDNATAVAVTLGTAEAMAKCAVKPKRSVLFLLFGAEEQAVNGSNYYVNTRPLVPLDKTVVYINMEAAGTGDRFHVSAGANFPKFYEYLKKADEKYVHRDIGASPNSNIARPRQDVAWFLWKGVPGVTVSAGGAGNPNASKHPSYHNSYDNLSLVTPEIMEDMARMFLVSILDIADAPDANFRN